MKPVEHPGDFLAQPYRWVLWRGHRTASLNLSLWFILTKEFIPMGPPLEFGADPYEAEGMVNIVKGNGEYNERSLETLVTVLGWDGLIPSLEAESQWKPSECRVEVALEEYTRANGVVSKTLKVKWINSADGARRSQALNAEERDEVIGEHGANLAAIAAAIKAGKPIPKLGAAKSIPDSREVPF